jgi:hypothetical protein
MQGPSQAMPNTEYPSGEDVRDLLEQAEIDVCNLTFEEEIADAIDTWERETGYKPFLQGASASYFYDPPGPDFRGEARGGGRILELGRGFTAITAVACQITPTDSTGVAKTVLTDYNLLPYNALADNNPYTAIEFKYPVWGLPRSLKVTGTPGYSANIPDSAYRAMIKLAGAGALKTLREGLSQDAVEWAEGDVRERSSIELLQKLGNTWAAEARRAMRRFTLMVRY